MKFVHGIALICLLLLSSCYTDRSPSIEVQDPWVRLVGMMDTNSEEDMGLNSAAYMTLKNSGKVSDKLLRVDSDVAQAVELHVSEMKDGVMRMHPVEFIEVPAQSSVELQPGGLHIMLIGVKKELGVGDSVLLDLIFEQSGKMTVSAEVRVP